jgi:HlyD family secretion protein
VTYRTAPVKRGELLATISASGTVEPEEVVDVGAQVQGRILELGDDPKNPGHSVDYNSTVEEGQLLARIDDALYKADVDSKNAALESAKASVARAEADLKQYKAKLTQAKGDWDRAQAAGDQVISKADYDAYKAALETADANVAVGEAAIIQAKATVTQAEADLKRAQQNLDYCTIPSPVKGQIIERRVNKGQTVVSSLNAPSLFLIGKDLTKMVVWASVNEADIGRIKEGQKATFTVDTFPGRVFKGVVSKVRLSATMTQNVVTYTVEISADNSDMTLKPYLTANVQFEEARRENALLVPNTALRWMPSSAAQVSPEARNPQASDSGGGGARRQGEGAMPAAAAGASTTGPTTRPRRGGGGDGTDRPSSGTVWVQDGEFVKPLKLRIGKTDGTNTEVLSGDLAEGASVITGEIRADAAGADDAKNPFMPQFGRRNTSGGGGSGGGGGGGGSGGARRGG